MSAPNLDRLEGSVQLACPTCGTVAETSWWRSLRNAGVGCECGGGVENLRPLGANGTGPRPPVVKRWGEAGAAFVAYPTALIERRAELKITPAAVGVLLALFAHWKGNGPVHPTLERLVSLTGYSKPTVVKAIHQLEEEGHLNVKRGRKANGHRQVNIYTWPGLIARLNTPPSDSSSSETATSPAPPPSKDPYLQREATSNGEQQPPDPSSLTTPLLVGQEVDLAAAGAEAVAA